MLLFCNFCTGIYFYVLYPVNYKIIYSDNVFFYLILISMVTFYIVFWCSLSILILESSMSTVYIVCCGVGFLLHFYFGNCVLVVCIYFYFYYLQYIMFCCRFPITLLFWNLFIYFYVYCLYCILVLVSYVNLILESVFLFLCVPVLSLKCSGVGLLLLSYFGICISISMSNIYIMFWF